MCSFTIGLLSQFVLQFESVVDRDWYLEDPVRIKLQNAVERKIGTFAVLGFESGVF